MPSLQRRMVQHTPAPATGFGMPKLARTSGFIAIVDDGRGVAPSLAEKLSHLGVQAKVLHDPHDTGDVYGVIYLGGLRTVISADEAMAINRDAFRWARMTGSALAQRDGLFVTVQDTGGDFGLSGQSGLRVWSAGLPGLVKTARLEWITCAVKAIDLDCADHHPDRLATRLLDELMSGGPEIEVGLSREGQRITVVDVDQSQQDPGLTKPTQAAFITLEDVLVVSGGARGVTAACMETLASVFHPKLALLGRTAIVAETDVTQGAQSDAALKRVLLEDSKRRHQTLTPMELTRQVQGILASREIVQTVRSLEAKGSVVRYYDVDVQDEAALANVLDAVRQSLGPITGIIHAAGVIADKPILQKTEDQFDWVFNTKVRGFQALLNVTALDPLRVICCFSSIAARTGNIGQSDYAMANEVLNKLAAAEAVRRPNCVVTSLGWGAWQGGMVTPSLKRHFEELGVPLIPIEAGSKAFVEAVLANQTEVVIVPEGMGRLSGSQQSSQWSMTLTVDEIRFPCLRHHVIAGVPVVPVAFVIDWLVRAAEACRPDLVVGACEDLRVIRGIRLDQFSLDGHRLHLRLEEMPTDAGTVHSTTLKAEIRAEDGRLHYHATVYMKPQQDGTALGWITPEKLMTSAVADIVAGPTPHDATNEIERRYGSHDTADYDPYREHLFHGPAFYAIHDVASLSPSVLKAEFKPPSAIAHLTEWNGADTVDAILLDAGLQAASLWGTYTIDRKTLPTSLQRYVAHGPGIPARCIVIGKSATPLRTITDVYFFSADDQPLSALLGLEMHVVGGKDD